MLSEQQIFAEKKRIEKEVFGEKHKTLPLCAETRAIAVILDRLIMRLRNYKDEA